MHDSWLQVSLSEDSSANFTYCIVGKYHWPMPLLKPWDVKDRYGCYNALWHWKKINGIPGQMDQYTFLGLINGHSMFLRVYALQAQPLRPCKHPCSLSQPLFGTACQARNFSKAWRQQAVQWLWPELVRTLYNTDTGSRIHMIQLQIIK